MNAGMIAAISAVVVDSVVTLIVGWKLQHTARDQIAKGVQDIMEHAPTILAESLERKLHDD